MNQSAQVAPGLQTLGLKFRARSKKRVSMTTYDKINSPYTKVVIYKKECNPD